MTVSILPSNATPFERAVERVSAERWDALDVDIIRRARDPWSCPEHLLPQLAYQRSVDIWDDAWPIEKKRQVIADAPEDHHLKTTTEGAIRYLRHAGAAYRRSIVPPAATFLGAALTEDQRSAFLARYPQLRIYPYVAGTRQRFTAFTTKAGGRARHYLGEGFPRDTHAHQRHRRVARLYEPSTGEMVDLTYREVERIDRNGVAVAAREIVLPPRRSGAIYLDVRPSRRRFFGPSGARERIVTLYEEVGYSFGFGQLQYRTVSAGLDPIDPQIVLVGETGKALAGARFPARRGRAIAGAFLPRSRAWRRLYERTHLFDPERQVSSYGRGTAFLGATRLGWPDFTSAILARVQGKRPRMAAGKRVGGYLLAGDRGPLNLSLDALAASKALADRYLLDSKHMRLARVGDRQRVGQAHVGDFVKA